MYLSRPLFVLGILLSITPLSAFAEDEKKEFFGGLGEKFEVHGYLSLAYADLNSDSERPPTGNEVIIGIPEDGVWGYGNAALLVRSTPAERHTFILQLSGRHLGDSPVSDSEDAIELDWLYYQYQFSNETRFRLGRFAAPMGIFNEIRDVGVLLPFFRPSYIFYREGSILSETIDGIGVSHRFFSESPWSLDADIYYGEYDILEQSIGLDDGTTEVGADNALGVQFWLNSPLSELRFGLGGQRWDVGAESSFNIEETRWESWYVSVDSQFDRFIARAEFRRLETSAQPDLFSPKTEASLDLFYFQFGWLASEKLSFYIQPEFADITQEADIFFGGKQEFREREDIGFSAVYSFRPDIVLKAEYHAVRSEITASDRFVLSPEGPKLLREFSDSDSDYSILSLSVSF